MIISTSILIKLAILLLVLALGWRMLWQSNRKYFTIFAVCAVGISVLAGVFSGMLPSLTDTVTLTAMGEKREEAQAMEVYLEGYTVDGESFIAGESLKITDGKWFWSGENYAWRPETDSRQPDGTTRSVSVKIPVGWERTLNFSGNIWRGFVQITTDSGSKAEDTYSDFDQTISISIEKSSSFMLIANQIIKLLFYMVFCLVFCGGILWILVHLKKSKAWFEKYNGKLAYFLIAAVTGVLMLFFAPRFQLWGDEFIQMYGIKHTFKDIFIPLLYNTDLTPPLFSICSFLWYKIAPWGERWLFLITIVPVSISIYIIRITGEKIKNKFVGLAASILLAFSSTTWIYQAYEFRSYSFTLLFSTISLYAYYSKIIEPSKKWSVIFSISMVCMAMSHYFGMLVCGIYFLCELYFMFKEKISLLSLKKLCIPFIPAGVCSVLWLAAVFSISSYADKTVVHPVPDISNFQSMLRYLTGNYEVMYILLLVSFSFYIASFFIKNKQCKLSIFELLSATFIIFMLGLMFIYGRFISPEKSLWNSRYYLILVPHIWLLISNTINNLIQLCVSEHKFSRSVLITFLTVLVSLNCLTKISTYEPKVSYEETLPSREAADWIYTQSNDIFSENTLITCLTYDNITDAWNEYYIARKGRRDALNICSLTTMTPETINQYDVIYIWLSDQWMQMPGWFQELLNNNYSMSQNHSDIGVLVYNKI